MLTYTGIHVTKEFGAPSILDIAVQSMRLLRFSGAGEVNWPIGMHMLFVADLVVPKDDPWLRLYALLHDASEVAVADVPRPMKTAEARAVEDAVQARIYASLGIPQPSEEARLAVKLADFRAALAEGTCGCSGRGFEYTQTNYLPDNVAISILREYLARFTIDDAFRPEGHWPKAYESRVRIALREVQQDRYHPDQGVAA